MNRQKKLGQNFLKSKLIAKFIVDSAKISKNNLVLEIGTGRGILIPYLVETGARIISIENDKKLFHEMVEKFGNLDNLNLKYGDGFKINQNFSILVSNLPYSQSRTAVEWLLQKKFTRAIVMLQKDFVQKLVESGKNRRAISILTAYGFNIEILKHVKKHNFLPIPKIDSVIIQITQKQQLKKELILNVNKLFSYRRKTVQNISKQFGKNNKSKKRLEELTTNEIIKLAKDII
jgi:16S rRNA (adenine1518-N6/adenine1519-N6)-dimethyltransferase